jgi:hypothetical protein
VGRFRSAGSYAHSIQRIGPDHYRLSWAVDRYYAGSRLRFPRTDWRDTDTAGAKRFAKKWNVDLPPVPGGSPAEGE